MAGEDHKVLITGAASGLGKALANCHGQAGWKLVLVDKNPEVKNLAAKWQATALLADLTVEEELMHVEQELASGVDRLILNAGATAKQPFRDYTRVQLVEHLDLNVKSLALLARAYAQESGSSHRQLAIVSSSISRIPVPGLGVYGPSKAFQTLLGASLALEKDLDVEVIVFEPSGMKTGFQSSAGVPSSEQIKLLDPEIVASEMMRQFAVPGFTPRI